MLKNTFFNRDAKTVAKNLLGKVLRHRYNSTWLSCQIIETESYYANEKGSHSSLGFTKKRKAMFMPPGTIYMYYARGGDSLNISVKGKGNAVLIKSALPFTDTLSPLATIQLMQQLNPVKNTLRMRQPEKLCSGQTLLCKSLNLHVTDWDQNQFDLQQFYIEDVSLSPKNIIQTRRLGIPQGRDEHLFYRFIDYEYAKFCTSNPLSKRNWQEGCEYHVQHCISPAR